MIKSISIALTGLDAATKRLSASASNIANFQTVGSLEDGGQAPYTPVETQQATTDHGGVHTQIVARQNPFVPVFSPDSPHADANGVIGIPNVSLPEEFVNLSLAKVQYKASLKLIEVESELAKELFRTVDRSV